uniref:Poly(A) polymerase gamma n=1 Tax=Bactrocera dorsalis TaxID=27457 RepID=A0A034WR58_BACDO
MWFIGLEFASAKNLNVNLTACIQTFTDQVMQHAANINMLKYGMQLDTCHVKRKDLSQYLDKDFLKRERKAMEQHTSFENAISTKAKRSSSEMSSEEEGGIAKKSRSSGSEDSS